MNNDVVNNLFNKLEQVSESNTEEHSNNKQNNFNTKSPEFTKSPDFNYNKILFTNTNNLILNNSNININIINNQQNSDHFDFLTKQNGNIGCRNENNKYE